MPMVDAATAPAAEGAAAASALDSADIWGEDDILTNDVKSLSNDEINMRIRGLESEIKIHKSEQQRMHHELKTNEEKIKDNKDRDGSGPGL